VDFLYYNCLIFVFVFLHWSVTGDADELIKQAKEIIMQTATYQNHTGNTRTPTSGGP